MKKKSFFQMLVTIALALVLLVTPFLTQKIENDSNQTVRTTTVEATESSIDHESILNKFEEAVMTKEDNVTTFVGYQTYDMNELLSEVDEVSHSSVDIETETRVKYTYTYNEDTNLVTLKAEMDNNGEVVIDEVVGEAFLNENGEIDAILDLDGEEVLLSELQGAGMIQNCGWFKNLIKKIKKSVVAKVVVAAVAVVAVSAVASVVAVATCGVGLVGATVAGAVAGGIAGGIAGVGISYEEYGKLDWRWIAGGVVIGAALGAAVGYGVGYAMGAGSATTTNSVKSLIDSAQKGELDFSNSIKNKSYFQKGSADYRPYYEQANTISKEIMQSKNPVIESSTNYLKWNVPGAAQIGDAVKPTTGVWELVIDPVKKIIVHFLFKT